MQKHVCKNAGKILPYATNAEAFPSSFFRATPLYIW